MSHAKDFGLESKDEHAARQIQYDYRQAGLTPEDQALCDYAIKLTVHPHQMSHQDVVKLQQLGFTDEQITVAAQVIGYFNYINRIADGLGVDLEDRMTMSVEDWLEQKTEFRDIAIS